MKILTALLVLVSTSAFAEYTPVYEARVTSESTITLTVGNDSDATVDCGYKMSWFENTLSYKRVHGEMTLSPGDVVDVNIRKDIATKVSFLKASVVCE